MPRPSPVAIAALILIARASLAGGPAAIAPDPDLRMRESFERFAAAWMSDLRERAVRQRERPRLRHGPNAPVVTYRAYGEDLRLELRPTGRPGASHTGILHYTEHVYSCADLQARLPPMRPCRPHFRFSLCPR